MRPVVLKGFWQFVQGGVRRGGGNPAAGGDTAEDSRAAARREERQQRRGLRAAVRRRLQRWRIAGLRRVRLCCDEPCLIGKRPPLVSGTLVIRGWVLARRGVRTVHVSCDGRPVGCAAYGMRRNDLGRLFGRRPDAYRSGFIYLLDTRGLAPGIHRLTMTAETSDGRTTSLSGPIRVKNFKTAYYRWRDLTRPNAASLNWMARNQVHLHDQPLVSLALVLKRPGDTALLAATVRSLEAQAYEHWELRIAATTAAGRADGEQALKGLKPDPRISFEAAEATDAAAAANRLLRAGAGELFGLLDAGDVLEPDALFEVVYHFNRHPDCQLVYSDEDVLAAGHARSNPFFKPDWSPDLLLGMNYVGRLWVARKQTVEEVGGFRPGFGEAGEYDLLLRFAERAAKLDHIPKVLCGRPAADAQAAERDGHLALQAALKRRRIEGEVAPGAVLGSFRVRRPQARGLVSVIIPMAASSNRLVNCVRSIVETGSSVPYEIVIAHPGTEGKIPGARALRSAGCRFVGCPPRAGLAQLLDAGAARCAGEYLLFVSPGEAVAPGWIEALCEQARRPEVGAVGAKVVDRRGRVSHAGMFLVDHGTGAAHAFRSLDVNDPGPFGLLSVPRDCTAVSSSCMMVRRQVFRQLGGFDELLSGTQRDMDFCQRARQEGYQVLTTPFAVWRDDLPDEPPAATGAKVYWDRWRTAHERGDPYHGPNLSARAAGCDVTEEPVRVTHAPCPLIEPKQVRRILAVKLDHLGDIITTLPALRRLRDLFPNAEITALVGSWARAMVEADGSADRVLTYDFFEFSSALPHKALTPRHEEEIANWLGGFGFDLAVDLRREADTRLFLRLSGARYTAGFALNDECEWLTVSVPWDPLAFTRRARRHATQDCLRLVEALALAANTEISTEVVPTAADREAADRLLAGLLLDPAGLVVGLHPGAGRAIKCWPVESFARLGDAFASRLGATVLLLGGPAETGLADNVLGQMRHVDRVLSLAGRLSVGELLAVLRRCDLFVGNDSGTTHLAGAAGIPTLGVHAATSDPAQWAALGPAAVAIDRRMLCSPCHFGKRRQCPFEVACMRCLGVETVWDAALRTLLPRWAKLKAGRLCSPTYRAACLPLAGPLS